ncbi:TOBE-like domain-containing protein [Pedococcus soli]
MSFLGSVARLGGQLVRPHDIALERNRDRAVAADALTGTAGGVVESVVERVVRLGFEVRIDLRADSGQRFAAQVTRGQADVLGLQVGETVYARATHGPDAYELDPALAI